MENTLQGTPCQEHLLDDIDHPLVLAPSGKRFANYIIDLIVIYIAWKAFFKYLGLRIVLTMIGPDDGKAAIYLKVGVVAFLFDISLMAAIEFFGHGRSPGKLLTRTRAVNNDGTPITFKTAVLRRLSRMVPFEAFSALASHPEPWHDRWTNTCVIDDNKKNRR
jgi:uncharacterized RDD family membrane protein YckC